MEEVKIDGKKIFPVSLLDAAVLDIAAVRDRHYYGLSIAEMMQLAYQSAVKGKVLVHQLWRDKNTASKQWFYGYIKRHLQLTSQTPEQTSMNRVKAFCRENVDNFFRNLGQVIDSFNASSIWNKDESGFSTVPSKMGKIISMKSVKRVGQITSGERGTMITLAVAISAAGNTILSFFCFREKNGIIFTLNMRQKTQSERQTKVVECSRKNLSAS